MQNQDEGESLIDAVERHYEAFLGNTQAFSMIPLASYPEGHYHIAEYKDRPCTGAVTLATIGLSQAPVHMFRQELLFTCYERFVTDDMIKLIAVVAEMMAESQHPLLGGDFLPPAGPLLPSTPMEAFYIAPLMYFNNDVAEFDSMQAAGVTVNFAWLLPIYSAEAAWIVENGAKAFEHLLVQLDPDALDLARPPIV